MAHAFGQIPFFDTYRRVRAENENAGMNELAQVAGVQQVFWQLRKQQMEEAAIAQQAAMRQALGGISPDASSADVVKAVLPYASPDQVLRTLQGSEDRKATIAATQETAQARISAQQEAAAARLEQAAQTAAQQHQYRLDRLADSRERAAESARHAKVMEGIQAQMVQLRRDAVAGEAKPPAGFRWKPDGSLEAIKGGPADKTAKGEEGLTPENAGKVSMSQQAVDGIGQTRKIIFDEKGGLNRNIVGAMNLPLVSGLPGNSQARIARTAMRNAVEAKLRIETGAAATESEVQRTLARFMPTVADTADSAKYKMDELEKFFKTSLSMTKGIPAARKEPVNTDPLGIR